MIIESAYAVALFGILVLNGGEPSQVLFVYLLLFIVNRSGNHEMEQGPQGPQGTETSFYY